VSAAVLASAEKAIAAGLSIIPIRANGEKKTGLAAWKQYQSRRASLQEAQEWFKSGTDGVAVIGGKVSNGTEILDFDRAGLWGEFQKRAESAGVGDLVRRVAEGYSECSPNGFHLIYRAPDPKTLKLAKLDKTTTLIETRGEGAYCIVAPSNGRVHPSGRPYELMGGGFDQIETLTPDEHETLLSLARSFNEYEPTPQPERPLHVASDDERDRTRPGDDFNVKASWASILEPHGWTFVYSQGEAGYWRRPSKSQGISASTDKYPGILLVFSTSTEFESTLEQSKGYTKFAAYAFLNNGGDFSAAARDLGAQGYGEQNPRRVTDTDRAAHPGEPQSPLDANSTEPPQAADGLPTILTNTREAREVVSDIVFAIAKANVPPTLFSRIGHVVRIARNDLGVGEARQIIGADQLNVVSASADFTRFDARAKAPTTTHPRRELCAAAFARLEVGEELPRLLSVTPTPIIHEDGTIIDFEGYDPLTAAYYAPAKGFKLGEIPEKPTDDQAQRALMTLVRPFQDFPFATRADRANFLAVLITVVVRLWFRTVPFFVFEAPIQGAGKTLIAMATRGIAEGTTGIGAAPESGKQGDGEWRKRITSILLTAPSVAIIDNVTGTLGGPTLAALSTSPMYSDRLLGTNESPDLPNTATWIFTSNNAQVDADLLRRCVFIRLDPRNHAPHLRTGFEIPDLIGHLENHRGEILAALYTIVRFWIIQGRPDAPNGTPVLGSFEKWSRVVPAILGAVDIEGVLGDIESRNERNSSPLHSRALHPATRGCHFQRQSFVEPPEMQGARWSLEA